MKRSIQLIMIICLMVCCRYTEATEEEGVKMPAFFDPEFPIKLGQVFDLPWMKKNNAYIMIPNIKPEDSPDLQIMCEILKGEYSELEYTYGHEDYSRVFSRRLKKRTKIIYDIDKNLNLNLKSIDQVNETCCLVLNRKKELIYYAPINNGNTYLLHHAVKAAMENKKIIPVPLAEFEAIEKDRFNRNFKIQTAIKNNDYNYCQKNFRDLFPVIPVLKMDRGNYEAYNMKQEGDIFGPYKDIFDMGLKNKDKDMSLFCMQGRSLMRFDPLYEYSKLAIEKFDQNNDTLTNVKRIIESRLYHDYQRVRDAFYMDYGRLILDFPQDKELREMGHRLLPHVEITPDDAGHWTRWETARIYSLVGRKKEAIFIAKLYIDKTRIILNRGRETKEITWAKFQAYLESLEKYEKGDISHLCEP